MPTNGRSTAAGAAADGRPGRGYVHASDQKSRTEGWFEVIAGKSVQTEGDAKAFAFVNTYDTKPKRGLYEVLQPQGQAIAAYLRHGRPHSSKRVGVAPSGAANITFGA